jgi:hypothetical protein
MEANLTLMDRACYWLADHPWLTCALLCAVNLAAALLDVVLP